MNNIDISVIIPTYGRPQYLRRAIDSVLRQEDVSFEIIVVDDNDPGDPARAATEALIQFYSSDHRLIYVKHECNKNGAAARNTGIGIAKGRYITFLDNDDVFLKGRLSKCVSCLNENSRYDAVYTNAILMEKGMVKTLFNSARQGSFPDEMLKLNSFFGTGSNFVLRREAVIELNGFDVSFIRHQDLEFMARFFIRHEITHINEILVVKFREDSLNVPDLRKAYHVRYYFYSKFRQYIPPEKESVIYKTAYIDLYSNLRSAQDKQLKAEIIGFLRSKGLYTARYRLRAFLLNLRNSPLGRPYYQFKNRVYKNDPAVQAAISDLKAMGITGIK